MKVISKERTHVEKYNVYVANDGTEFMNEGECRKYDESAKGVLNAMLRKIMVKETYEENLLDFGSSDNAMEIYRPTCEEDKKTIMQMYLLVNPHLSKAEHQHYIESAEKLIDRAIKESDYLLVGRGYDYDGFWLYGTCHSMQERIENFCKQAEKKDENA
jgi:hypothetical protein